MSHLFSIIIIIIIIMVNIITIITLIQVIYLFISMTNPVTNEVIDVNNLSDFLASAWLHHQHCQYIHHYNVLHHCKITFINMVSPYCESSSAC